MLGVLGVAIVGVGITYQLTKKVVQYSNDSKEYSKQFYDLSYDHNTACPTFVHYELTEAMLVKRFDREHEAFKYDKKVKTAYPEDYTGTGYDRGHMVPAGDMSFDSLALDQTFYMSNICPQTKELNRGTWKHLEESVRDSVALWGKGEIWSGPIYSKTDSKYIGSKVHIKVPNAYWKVLKHNDQYYTWICQNGKSKSSSQCQPSDPREVMNITGLKIWN